MPDNMTVEDAINVVHVLGCELASGGDEDVRELISAATFDDQWVSPSIAIVRFDRGTAMIEGSVTDAAASAALERSRSEPAVLFLDDVAALLRVSRSTIERRRRQGTFPIPELPPLDRRPRWSRGDVERFLESSGRIPAAPGRPRRRR